MDPALHKNDRGQPKRARLEDFAGLSGKSLDSERSVSRSRDPSQQSRGDSSVRADFSVYIPAHQRDRRIGESNSDSRRKEFYDQRREAVSSRDHGHDYAKDRDRSKDYGKDKDRDRHRGAVRDPRSSGRDPTPDRRSHSREKVDDHKKRAGIRGTRRTVKTQGKGAATSLLIQRGIDHATVSVLKLMMIIPMYARFSMLRRWLRKLTGQKIDYCLLPFPTLRVTLAYLAYTSMFCLTQERGRRNISMKRRRLVFVRWALNARNVVLRCVAV